MAGIVKKADAYYCRFRFGGKRHYFTLGKITESQARAKAMEIDETLDLIERGRLTVPADIPLRDFVVAGGRVPSVSVRPETINAGKLFEQYLLVHANGTIEENSLKTAKTHLNQFTVSLGERFRVQALTLNDLQNHVERRRKKHISPVTLKKVFWFSLKWRGRSVELASWRPNQRVTMIAL